MESCSRPEGKIRNQPSNLVLFCTIGIKSHVLLIQSSKPTAATGRHFGTAAISDIQPPTHEVRHTTMRVVLHIGMRCAVGPPKTFILKRSKRSTQGLKPQARQASSSCCRRLSWHALGPRFRRMASWGKSSP